MWLWAVVHSLMTLLIWPVSSTSFASSPSFGECLELKVCLPLLFDCVCVHGFILSVCGCVRAELELARVCAVSADPGPRATLEVKASMAASILAL